MQYKFVHRCLAKEIGIKAGLLTSATLRHYLDQRNNGAFKSSALPLQHFVNRYLKININLFPRPVEYVIREC